MATAKENLIKAAFSGASSITIDGHTINLRDQDDLLKLIEMGDKDLLDIVKGNVRPGDHVAQDLSGFA